MAIYELRQNKCQMIPAHSHPITALAFSPDGKYLVSYSCAENRLSFWQTSTGKLNRFKKNHSISIKNILNTAYNGFLQVCLVLDKVKRDV